MTRDTSDEARSSISPEAISRLQGHILVALERHGPLTDEEIIDLAESWSSVATDSSIRTRRAELVEMGKVAATEERRPSRSGRAMTVWALTRVSPLREDAEEPFAPSDLPTTEVESGMRPNSMPGRPDRYVNVKVARNLAADASRKAKAEAAERGRREVLEEKRKQPWLEKPPRVDFGDTICRSCKATGGNQADGPCLACKGEGVHRGG